MDCTKTEIDELVVNWHLTEACNFQCRYCYAAWAKPKNEPELWRDEAVSRELLESLYSFFSATNDQNPLRTGLRWRALRLSLAGGEPTLLGARLTNILTHAKTIGFKTSLITNASRQDVVLDASRHLDMLGISIDSVKPSTNEIIGRRNQRNEQVSLTNLLTLVEQVRRERPELTIKINTVVNAANADEDMSELIAALRPERWKIMRMLPKVSDGLEIDQAAFLRFVGRHNRLHTLMSVEDNTNMEQSYIMIDPHGRFFQNEPGKAGYIYSFPITKFGAQQAFDGVTFEATKFAARYPSRAIQEI